MIVTYSPVGEEPQVWEFDPSRVRALEAELIEKKYGESWDSYKQAVLNGSMKARRILLWHLQRKQHPVLRLEDVDFAAADLRVELTRGELQGLRDAVAKARGIDDADRARALEAIDGEMETAPEGLNEGKAL